MTQVGFFPPLLLLGGTASSSCLVKGFCEILLPNLFAFLLRRIQFSISTLHCFILHERGKKVRNPFQRACSCCCSMKVHTFQVIIKSCAENLWKLEKAKNSAGISSAFPTLPSTCSVSTCTHFPPSSHDLNKSTMDTQTSLSML